MRKGITDVGYIEDGDNLNGFCLGSDGVAEHEWGIKDLRRIFEMDDEAIGMDRRIVRTVPKRLAYRTSDKQSNPDVLALMYPDCIEEFLDDKSGYNHCQELRPYSGRSEPPEFTGAWSENDIGIAAFSNKAKKLLAEVVDAMVHRDVAIFVAGTGNNPFKNGGLCVVIASRVSEANKQLLLDNDIEKQKLKEAADATGIKDVLKRANKGFFSLRPTWVDTFGSTKDGEVKTVHPVIFWLNPIEQRIHNWGWYTVEQLQQWTEGKGPVMKESK